MLDYWHFLECKHEGISMKSILLASVSAFAFAGAAAAEVSWGGSASAEYNTLTGVSTSVTLDASASLAGDWTLSTSASFTSDDGDDGDWSTGTVSLTDGTSTLTFGPDHAFGAAGLDDEDDDDESADLSLSTTLGGVGVTATIDDAIDGNTEIGVTMSAGGADIEAGFVAAGADAGDFRLGLSTSLSGADVAFNTSSVGGVTAWDASLGMTVDAIDLTFSTASDSTWDLDASYTMGDLTVSAGIDETPGNYTVGIDYAMGGVGVSFSTDQANAWEASVSYSEGPISFTAGFDVDGLGAIEGSYDMGGGAVAMFGMIDTNTTYVGLEYDLGNGAALTASYATADIDSDDYAVGYSDGGTVAVSFDF
jgi:outer membrane protein OmpU